MDTLYKQVFVLHSDTARFTRRIEVKDLDEVQYMCITKAFIPKTYYMVQNDAQLFMYYNAVQHTMDIPKGNYNTESMERYLNAFFALVSLDIAPGGGVAMVMVPPRPSSFPDTGKFHFTMVGLNPADVVIMETSSADVAALLGLHANTPLLFQVNANNDHVAESPVAVDYQKHSTIMICSDLVEDGTAAFLTANTTPYGAMIEYHASDLFVDSRPVREQNRNTNLFEFCLRDGNDQVTPLVLNGGTITLELTMWRMDPVSRLTTQLLRMLVRDKGEDAEPAFSTTQVGMNALEESKEYNKRYAMAEMQSLANKAYGQFIGALPQAEMLTASTNGTVNVSLPSIYIVPGPSQKKPEKPSRKRRRIQSTVTVE